MSDSQRSTRTAIFASVAAAGAGLILGAVALAGSVGAGDAPGYRLVQGVNPTCADLGYDNGFKIDQSPQEGQVYSNGAGLDVTTFDVGVIDGNAHFGFSSTQPVDAVLVKAGSDNHRFYEFSPATTGQPRLFSERDSISHVNFCWNDNGSTTSMPDGTTTTTAPDGTTTAPDGTTTTTAPDGTTTVPDGTTTTTAPDGTTTVPDDGTPTTTTPDGTTSTGGSDGSDGRDVDAEPGGTPPAADSTVTGSPRLTG